MADLPLLEYESDILNALTQDNGLLVMARGLGLMRILIHAIEVHCKPSDLVLVLNTSPEEEAYITNELKSLKVEQLPISVTNEVSVPERDAIYYKGGVLFVTSRILVVDMLVKRIPFNLVTGIIVNRAHKLLDQSQEAFILRMFRQENSNGFIKGFSDVPTALGGYNAIERVMKDLFVRKLLLFPRFHETVIECLDKNRSIEVEELQVGLTEDMQSIQQAILEILKASLRDLTKAHPVLDSEEVSVENCLTDGFYKDLKRVLEPDWYKLSARSKQQVSDIKLMRTILSYLTRYDCITFNSFLNSLRKHDNGLSNDKSLWMLLDAADLLFTASQNRIKTKKSSGKKEPSEKDKYQFEVPPKWLALLDILKEIKESNENKSSNISGKALICASDQRCCSQLRNILTNGVEQALQDIYDQSIAPDCVKIKETMQVDSHENEFEFIPNDSQVVIHPLHGTSDPYDLLTKLYELEPTYVILYDIDMSFVRQLEVFGASRPGKKLRVYFLFYSNSVEEQRYLTTLRREKKAFELLIKQKSELVIPEHIPTKVNTHPEPDPVKVQKSSRKAGGQSTDIPVEQKIVVDMREFRSELPNMIHKMGVSVVPITLEVGDYILSTDICVERKSIADLIGSLNSGRLYKQAQQMTRFYAQAVLLIEFERTRNFSLQKSKKLSEDVQLQNVSSKLVLLTIHFPTLRIIWSQGPSHTAQIFSDLKMNRPQPDEVVASKIGVDAETVKEGLYSIIPLEMVKKMPGIDHRNFQLILNKFGSLTELVEKTEEEIAEVISNKQAAKQLFNFIHNSPQE